MQKSVNRVSFNPLKFEYRLLLTVCFLSIACISNERNSGYITRSGNFEYHLNDPDETFFLPDQLIEISGLDYFKDNVILCIEDEKGVLYFYDSGSREVIRKIDFGKSGDYEGVARIDQVAYVIKSNGNLYGFPIDQGDKVDAEKISTPLKSSNNVEGLTIGHSGNSLYLACKGKAEVNNNDLDGRVVYQFDLEERELDLDPYIHLTSGPFSTILKENDLNTFKHMPFKPSGIAIHPITKDVFLIGSVGKLMVILSRESQIKSMVPLSRRVLSQPEGICFDPEGNLFISSEGRNKQGYIQRFDYKN